MDRRAASGELQARGRAASRVRARRISFAAGIVAVEVAWVAVLVYLAVQLF